MNDYKTADGYGTNVFPSLLGGLNLLVLLQVGFTTQTFGVDFWEALFVALGAYWSIKGIRYIASAHDFAETKVKTQDLTDFPKKGIYSKIRHPIGAGFIYISIGVSLLFRSAACLVVVVPIFGAAWFMLAKYQDSILVKKFDEDYIQHMDMVGMFRGKGDHTQRLQDSGYGMY
ncbi:MAG: methyltransferase family protein [Candidatus Thorarchaeota archaeon]